MRTVDARLVGIRLRAGDEDRETEFEKEVIDGEDTGKGGWRDESSTIAPAVPTSEGGRYALSE